jgi:glycosyltransferase involved in cell wall biosynthesis
MKDINGTHARYPLVDEYRNLPPKRDRLVGGKESHAQRLVEERDLVSVVTVTYNAIATIERTIRSIVGQSYPNLEYILVDGGSKDGTIEVLRNWSDRLDSWVSESDSGISDAFNKGVAATHGEFVMIVNADDWLEPTHLALAVNALRSCDSDYVFGNLIVHDPRGRVIGSFLGDAAYEERIAHVMPFINHPSVVCRREAYLKYGLFSTDLHHAMDYEWFLRVSRRGGRGTYLPELTSHMTLDGRSDRYFPRSLAEVREISIAYGYPAYLAWPRFLGRLLKAHARRQAERFLPEPAWRLVRRAVNRSFV